MSAASPAQSPLDLLLSLPPESFGAAIRAARQGLKWSQDNLAREAGVSQASVVRIEQGGSGTRPDMRRKVAQALERHGVQWQRQASAPVMCEPNLAFRVPGRQIGNGFAPVDQRHWPLVWMQTRQAPVRPVNFSARDAAELEREGSFRRVDRIGPDDPASWIG